MHRSMSGKFRNWITAVFFPSIILLATPFNMTLFRRHIYDCLSSTRNSRHGRRRVSTIACSFSSLFIYQLCIRYHRNWLMDVTSSGICIRLAFISAPSSPPVLLLLLLVDVFVVVAAASIVVALRRGEYPRGEGADGIVIRRPRLPPPRPPPFRVRRLRGGGGRVIAPRSVAESFDRPSAHRSNRHERAGPAAVRSFGRRRGDDDVPALLHAKYYLHTNMVVLRRLSFIFHSLFLAI